MKERNEIVVVIKFDVFFKQFFTNCQIIMMTFIIRQKSIALIWCLCVCFMDLRIFVCLFVYLTGRTGQEIFFKAKKKTRKKTIIIIELTKQKKEEDLKKRCLFSLYVESIIGHYDFVSVSH